MKLTKRVPARTKTIVFNWLREFMEMNDQYKVIRNQMGGTMLCCFWCKTKFENGQMIWLGNIKLSKGKCANKVFCSDCGTEASKDDQ